MTKAEINADFIASLRHAFGEGKHGLSAVPGLIKKIMHDDMWREFYDEVLRDIVKHKKFESFVIEQPPRGLGTTVKQLRNLCVDDTEALDAIDKLTQHKAGGDHGNQYTGGKVDNIQDGKAPTGTSKARALRKLRKDAPAIHKKVLEGDISPHAGMIKAGFRKPTITLTLTAEAFLKASWKLTTQDRDYIAGEWQKEPSFELGYASDAK